VNKGWGRSSKMTGGRGSTPVQGERKVSAVLRPRSGAREKSGCWAALSGGAWFRDDATSRCHDEGRSGAPDRDLSRRWPAPAVVAGREGPDRCRVLTVEDVLICDQGHQTAPKDGRGTRARRALAERGPRRRRPGGCMARKQPRGHRGWSSPSPGWYRPKDERRRPRRSISRRAA
jgi:hypothetical protein